MKFSRQNIVGLTNSAPKRGILNSKDALGHGSEKRYSVVKDSPFNRENAKEFIGHAFLHGHEPSYAGVDEPVEGSKLKPGTMRWEGVGQFRDFHNLKNSSKQNVISLLNASPTRGLRNSNPGHAARHELESDEGGTAREKAQRLHDAGER
jgi:hypothetical protein